MRHKRILDVAAEKPNASVAELAREVPSVTSDVVERVLEEHGDPAASETPSASDDPTTGDGANTATTDGGNVTSPVTQADEDATTLDTPTNTDADTMALDKKSTDDGETGQGGTDVSEPSAAVSDGAEPELGTDEEPSGAVTEDDSSGEPTATDAPDVVDPTELTAVERETLRAIHANPAATQRALAEELGVSAATVSQRVNGIDGFEWSDRASFVEDVFDAETGGPTPAPATVDDAAGDALADALSAVQGQLETLIEQQCEQTAFDDPELASKVVHACMDAETISEDEELRIIRTLLA